MNLFAARKRRKEARELLRHSRHVRQMREDIMRPADVEELLALEATLREAILRRDVEGMQTAAEGLQGGLSDHIPPRSMPGIRENVEILVVAVAVAMACRTYFIQPFKIPTGSMQPTLYGIQYLPQDGPALMDHMPLKLCKWAFVGKWYMEVKAKTSGFVRIGPDGLRMSNSHVTFYIGNIAHTVPREGILPLSEYVAKGTVLWRGVKVAGDHVFVDKMNWNFRSPKRGQITVFNTGNIEGLPPKTHYIKRLVGLPGDHLSIDPPRLLNAGEPILEPEGIGRICREEGEYQGYQLVDARADSDPDNWGMRTPGDTIRLGPDEFFTLGDNTGNSRDGRYWGTVPRANLVGPAVFVYWPYSRRWGIAD